MVRSPSREYSRPGLGDLVGAVVDGADVIGVMLTQIDSLLRSTALTEFGLS